MRVVIQRVSHASVTIEGVCKSAIKEGFMILVGIEEADTQEDADWLCKKIIGLRVLKEGMNITLAKRDGSLIKSKIKELHTFEGLGGKKTNAVSSGDICAVVGVEGFEIGDTICDFENPEPLPPIAIDEPTMSMLFTINDSPFCGKEGKFVTSRHIQDLSLIHICSFCACFTNNPESGLRRALINFPTGSSDLPE